MITVTHRVESGGANEDRLLVEHHGKRTVAIICDGAGNGGRGGMAADLAIAELSRIAQAGFTDWMRALVAVDQLLKRQAQGGETTCVVVDISDSGECRGASVGDSGAWMLPAGSAVRDLTAHQDRARLGSGHAHPVRFKAQLMGRLVLESGRGGLKPTGRSWPHRVSARAVVPGTFRHGFGCATTTAQVAGAFASVLGVVGILPAAGVNRENHNGISSGHTGMRPDILLPCCNSVSTARRCS